MFTVLMQTIQRDSAISFPMFGDFSVNPPASFTIFGINIYFYGVIIAVGFLLGICYCIKVSRPFGIGDDNALDIILWAIPAALVGARLYYVLFRLDYYLANPGEIIAVWNGGMAIYGGVIGAIIAIYFVCRHKKIAFLAALDMAISGLIIGQIIGRWGNFMNREAFGAETDIFCRMGLTTAAGETIFVHPTFLYESLWNLVGFIFLAIFISKNKRKYDGQISLIYFLWYGIGRTWIEGLRTDSLYIGNTGIRVSQLLSIVLALGALIILIVKSRKPHSPDELFVNRLAAAEDSAEDEAQESQQEEITTDEQ